MQAAAQGKSTIGIPPKVGREFVAGDTGGKLPPTGPAKPKRMKISKLPMY